MLPGVFEFRTWRGPRAVFHGAWMHFRGELLRSHQEGGGTAPGENAHPGAVAELLDRVRVSNAPVVPPGLVVDLSYERSGISSEAAESGRGGETGCGI
jgi:hypothetical protein